MHSYKHSLCGNFFKETKFVQFMLQETFVAIAMNTNDNHNVLNLQKLTTQI